MEKQMFHTGWRISSQSGKSMVESMMSRSEVGEEIILPYDAMIHESVKPDTKNAGQTGYYPGKLYYYTKEFVAPKEWEEKIVQLEFEGIYGKTLIYLNGDYVGNQVFGYTHFILTLDDFLKYGEVNRLEVVVNNEMEKNSRWYSGSGIYRDVQLYIGNRVYIPAEAVRISTPEVERETAVVEVKTELVNRDIKRHKVCIETKLIDSKGQTVATRISPVTLFGQSTEEVEQRLTIQNPHLWSCDDPNMYICKTSIIEEKVILDETEESFGIRKLQLDPIAGLRINGESIKLRGSCIHHDHGIIGAAALECAEERKIKQLKEAGFNCIRMSHHPAGKSLLRVCDRLGMLVIDELFDMWTHSKNANDFAIDFEKHWEEIADAMVRKDYNHPSVIIYSMGNEIQEAGTAKGAQINRRIHKKLKAMDASRYTTNAINGVLAAGDRFMEIVGNSMQQLGIPLPDPEKLEAQKTEDQEGSDALNSMMSIMVGPLADAIATNSILTEMTEEFVEAMDIAGYNYLTGRHAMENLLNPNRIVLGTETFPADIVNLWKVVKENAHVIGDMTWTGYDYLGEAGVGIFHYDGGVNFQAKYPERAAYIGDLDLLGNRRPISYYREIVYGLRKEPYIGVRRLNHYGTKVGRTPWMWNDNIASWTWPGYEGKPAIIDVLSDANEVELFLNGVSLGKKPAGENHEYLAVFEIIYEPGELKATAIRNGISCETFSIYTAAQQDVELYVKPDRTEMNANGLDLTYIMIELKDKNGRENLFIEKDISIEVEGEGHLAGFGSANPTCERSYFDTTCRTYDGRVMAVIRSGLEQGNVKVSITSEGLIEKEVLIKVQ